MVRPSSTSNSEPEAPLPGGFPWAFALAVGVVLLVELCFRQLPADVATPYKLGRREYYAAATLIEFAPPADICLIGSSRCREAISIPLLAQRAGAVTGRQLRVRSFAVGGAKGKEVNEIAEHIVNHAHPELMLYGVSCFQFCKADLKAPSVSIMWSAKEWWEESVAGTPHAEQQWPMLIASSADEVSCAYRYRRLPAMLANDWLRVRFGRPFIAFDPTATLRGGISPCPQRGGASTWQRLTPNKNIVNNPYPPRDPDIWMAMRLDQNGQYVFGDDQRVAFEHTIQLARRIGVTVVIFEIPLSSPLRKRLGRTTVERTRKLAGEVARTAGVRFVTLQDYDITWQDRDFLEWSHLNLAGANKLTNWLTEHVVVPELSSTRAEVEPR